MKHVAQVIGELRRYIAGAEARAELEETDSLLAVALEDLKRKIVRKWDNARPAKGRLVAFGAERLSLFPAQGQSIAATIITAQRTMATLTAIP